jgi:succinoglycan biosynthesis transport protein ExoP
MEDYLDLRHYLRVLLRWWWLIVGCALLAAVSAFAVSHLISPTYEATAVVIITQPRYELTFDPRFETVENAPAYNAFPKLATSDDVLQETVDAYTPSDEAQIEHWTAHTLAKIVKASSEGDPSLVFLTVSSRSPEDAAGIANAWAQVFAERGDAIYNTTEEEVAFFVEQVARAEDELQTAETALIDFQARNQAGSLRAQLDSLRQAQTDYLADKRKVAYLVQDIQSLRSQLAQQPSDQPATLADNLTTLYLQIKAFNAEAGTPIQLQVNDAGTLSSKSQAEQIAFLDHLTETLASKSTEIDAKLADLEPQLLDLQRQLQEIDTEGEQLNRTYNLANDTYTTLSRKLEEARISVQEQKGMLQIGSRAAVPEEPTGPRKLMNTALAGTVGVMLSTGGVFAWEWWQESDLAPARADKSEPKAQQHIAPSDAPLHGS